ncbi:MAG: hypothetical protein ABI592_06065 [Acidobacteriota bacterium]
MQPFDPSSSLPPLYARWIDALLRGPIPAETRATCDDCAMCAPPGAPPDEGNYFSPRTKCCTYVPTVPNFLVGRALEDGDFAFSAGRATLERRLDEGVGVHPLGVQAPARFSVLYDAGGPAAFGRAETLRCPHYLEEAGGRCGIWKHRNAICATWFCKYERGAVGMAFWDRLRDLLKEVEWALSTWCVLESGLDAAALESVFPPKPRPGTKLPMSAADVDGRPDPASARKVWGQWLGREREFYRECGRRVGPLAWEDVARIGGADIAVQARMTRQAHAELLSEKLPERLTPGTFQILSASPEAVRIVGYTGADALDLPPEILQVLPYFQGQPTREALETIESELGIRVEEDLVRKLADFHILADSRPGER